jgi:hypothetical protein
MKIPEIPRIDPEVEARQRARQRAESDALQARITEEQAHFYDRVRVEYPARGVRDLTPVEVGHVYGTRGIFPAEFQAAAEKRLNREANEEEREND